MKSSKPKAGEGATLYVGSDRYAYTVERVSDSGKTCWIREDDAVRTDNNGQCEVQKYEYKQNPTGELIRCFLNQRKEWVATRRYGCKCPVRFGERSAYRDPCF
jgi:hypothetical protein